MDGSDEAVIEAYLETGAKRVFAGALRWPGWCRSGRSESQALEHLLAYGSRYATILEWARIPFAMSSSADVRIVERITGNATTDFGAPGMAPSTDALPLDGDELRRYVAILEASWRALDGAVEQAAGREFRHGPRGGGRDPGAIVDHVRDSEASYFHKLGWQASGPRRESESGADAARRASILAAIAAVAPAGVPEPGPRGGIRWSARYFVRRAAWHVLDHAWEIEDRVIDPAP